MVNNDVLIKLIRAEGIDEWPDKVNYIRLHLPELLKGFPGIGLGHVTIVKVKDLLESDRFIYDFSLLSPGSSSTPPIMIESGIIIGIGIGPREHDLNQPYDTSQIPLETYVLRVDCRPKVTGGPGYYYFYKSKRDYSNE